VRSDCTLHKSSIPKGLWPPAQGCEGRATLGGRVNLISTPTGLQPVPCYGAAIGPPKSRPSLFDLRQQDEAELPLSRSRRRIENDACLRYAANSSSVWQADHCKGKRAPEQAKQSEAPCPPSDNLCRTIRSRAHCRQPRPAWKTEMRTTKYESLQSPRRPQPPRPLRSPSTSDCSRGFSPF